MKVVLRYFSEEKLSLATQPAVCWGSPVCFSELHGKHDLKPENCSETASLFGQRAPLSSFSPISQLSRAVT